MDTGAWQATESAKELDMTERLNTSAKFKRMLTVITRWTSPLTSKDLRILSIPSCLSYQHSDLWTYRNKYIWLIYFLSSYYLPSKPKYDIKILLFRLKAQLNISSLGKLSLAFQAKFATPASEVH